MRVLSEAVFSNDSLITSLDATHFATPEEKMHHIFLFFILFQEMLRNGQQMDRLLRQIKCQLGNLLALGDKTKGARTRDRTPESQASASVKCIKSQEY